MKTLNSIFVDRRLATSYPSVSQRFDMELAIKSDQWLARLNYLRSICYVPAEHPFANEPQILPGALDNRLPY